MQISHNKVVTLTYKLSDHTTGEQIEETTLETALTFLYGVGGMIPEFEEKLAGKTSGEHFDFHILAANAYGEQDPQHIVMLPANIFHDENGSFDSEMFQVGSMVPMSDSDGNQLRGRILEVNEETVQMDFNHPLAGTDLHFVGTILEVRDAEAEELAHGHAHGPHGHQH